VFEEFWKQKKNKSANSIALLTSRLYHENRFVPGTDTHTTTLHIPPKSSSKKLNFQNFGTQPSGDAQFPHTITRNWSRTATTPLKWARNAATCTKIARNKRLRGRWPRVEEIGQVMCNAIVWGAGSEGVVAEGEYWNYWHVCLHNVRHWLCNIYIYTRRERRNIEI